jgi:hypothetical protein
LKFPLRCASLTLSASVLATPAAAEMDAADYQLEQVIRSQAQRDRIRSEIEREVDQEAELAWRAALEQEQQGAEAAAAEARRPFPERLLQARCTLCHPPGNYLNQHHTLLGWHLVIARMRWLNRAARVKRALRARPRTRAAAPGGRGRGGDRIRPWRWCGRAAGVGRLGGVALGPAAS